MDLPHRARRLLPTSKFDRLKLKQKRRKPTGRSLWFGDNVSGGCNHSWLAAKFIRKLLAFRVARLKIMEEKKANSNDGISRRQHRSVRHHDNAGQQRDRHYDQSGAR